MSDCHHRKEVKYQKTDHPRPSLEPSAKGGLTSKQDAPKSSVTEQAQTLGRKRREKRKTEIAVKAAQDELSRLTSGEKVHELERQCAKLMKVRDHLKSKLAKLAHIQPVGIIARVFRGGRSSGSIAREMSLIGEHLPSLDRQIEKNSRNTEQARCQTTTIIQETPERIERLKQTIGTLIENIREIEGNVLDIELALEHFLLDN